MQTYSTADIRNIVLLGHNGDGKTTLAERLLFRSGALSRMGKIEDGTTASDYEPEEERRGGSVNLSVLPVEWKAKKLNILDTPGYMDFMGEMLSGLLIADTAVVLADASTGLQVGTDMAWRRASDRGLSRMIVIAKMDRENADYDTLFEAARERYGNGCAPILVPIGAGDSFRGVIDVLSKKAYLEDGTESDVSDDLGVDVDSYREQVIEAVAEADDDLATKYLEGEEITDEELMIALRAGVKSCDVFPVLASSGQAGAGTDPLLNVLAELTPSPADVAAPSSRTSSGEEATVTPDPDGVLAALIFKTTADPFVGKLSYFRVQSGTMHTNSHAWNTAQNEQERIAQIVVPIGKDHENVETLAPGDIGAVAKLGVSRTGETLSTREAGLALPGIQFPEPIFSVAVEAKTKADQDKMGAALTRLLEEDPSLTMTRESDTHEIIVSGLGDSHIDVAVQKLARKFGVEVEVGTPKVPYRETIRISTRAEYKHKKQTGGHGQYGHVVLQLEPLDRGVGFEFGEKVVGGSVPKNFIPAVEKGIRESLPEGAVAHFPIVDVRAVLVDGSFHAVDSSEMAFKIAASTALKQGIQQAQPVLLEPVMTLEVVTPEDFTGDVIGHLNAKRARVQGMNTENEMTTVQAEAPMSEVLRYSTELRSMTQGRASYKMHFSHYEEVPAHLAQTIIDGSATVS